MPADQPSVQRIRDPLHNLIVFKTKESSLDRTLWRVMCTRPFQRLRRIKQLGFSEIVYPGASHSRFVHSLGVMETARRLIGIIQERAGGERQETKENGAIAAALVHDVGHGPFSHAFEDVGKRLGLELADHEQVSDQLVRSGELAEVLNGDMGSGFANDVADMIKRDGIKTVHNSAISSQFDADRLDYMRRDRLMTGSGRSSVDFPWLLENLLIDGVKTGVDDQSSGTVPTFVIGPKAIHAAEAYILDLFQLYPTVYFHKTTRGAEKLFTELLVQLVRCVNNSGVRATGLNPRHPLVRFAKNLNDIDRILKLDDTVIWGSLSQLRESKDALISSFARRLQDRKLYGCVDIRTRVEHIIDPESKREREHSDAIDRCCEKILAKLHDIRNDVDKSGAAPRHPTILLDDSSRSAYKQENESKGPLEQVNVRTEGGVLMDLRQRSKLVAGIGEFKLTRAYFDPECDDCRKTIDDVIEEVTRQ